MFDLLVLLCLVILSVKHCLCVLTPALRWIMAFFLVGWLMSLFQLLVFCALADVSSLCPSPVAWRPSHLLISSSSSWSEICLQIQNCTDEHTSTDNASYLIVCSSTSHSLTYLFLMAWAALSCVPPPVSEPTAQCQSGSALLSICLKRHHYNQEPVWFSHFGFCHVTLWILLVRNGKFLSTVGLQKHFPCFYTSRRDCGQISPWIKRL